MKIEAEPIPIYIIYFLLTAIGLMPGGSVYKDHTFNKETAPICTSHENSTIQCTNFHSKIQVYEHKYKYMNITKHSRKKKIQKKTR
jgi:hypothetical protein